MNPKCKEYMIGLFFELLYIEEITNKDLFLNRSLGHGKERGLYVCPNGQELRYRTTTRKGYREYM
ncbi:hypothetical protein QFZ28_003997 [Neobacillus niacini]|jgi:hypothetical protein|uniref:hypothetical protein n=1 Tax=Neobacillus niacini TaxID=86668 RepID=UPI002782573E|nr:hypothetical protein [Neobacillus niacini]MDQ1003597.1 hypothetical protein [Neobacillus niacini]